jgi:hypothetical protein
MRYITIVALAFAFAGSAHAANSDLKPARKGGEEDTARKVAQTAAQQILVRKSIGLTPPIAVVTAH